MGEYEGLDWHEQTSQGDTVHALYVPKCTLKSILNSYSFGDQGYCSPYTICLENILCSLGGLVNIAQLP